MSDGTGKEVRLIAAVAANGVIGSEGRLPWRSRSDLARFRRLTMGCALVMGRKTFESIGKPLEGRHTVVVTRNKSFRPEGCVTCGGIDEALQAAAELPGDVTWIAGGAEIYRQTIGLADGMAISRFDDEFEGDAFFPDIDPDAWEASSEEREDEHPAHVFVLYYRRRK